MASHPAVSAHGPRAGTIESYAHALKTGAEYVEFYIRRTADGELAAFHDPRTRQGEPLARISYARLCELAGYEVPRVADVMTLIAGKAIGHLDIKDTGGEKRVVEMALDLLGPDRFVVTTLEDESVAAVKARFPAVPAALSLGRDLAEVRRSRWAATRFGELRPLPRLRACRADWVAVNHRLAGAGVLAQCHRAGLKTMIWTVDEDAGIRRWLADPRITVLITNRPADALALRSTLPSALLPPGRPWPKARGSSRRVKERGANVTSTCSPDTSCLTVRTVTPPVPVTSWTVITPAARASFRVTRVGSARRGSRLTTDTVSLLRPGSAVAATSSSWNRPRSATRYGSPGGSRCACVPDVVKVSTATGRHAEAISWNGW
jgi:glycerophosphoryl diester phosphodiesterase